VNVGCDWCFGSEEDHEPQCPKHGGRPPSEVVRAEAAHEGWLLGSAFEHFEYAERREAEGWLISARGARAIARERLAMYRARVGGAS
jgi:hypothetical protein